MFKWKIIGLVTLYFLIVGCEYYPLYDPDSSRAGYINETDITVSGNLDPEKLQSVLQDQFGKTTENINYHLTVDFKISDEGGQIQGSGGVNQHYAVGKAEIALFDLTSGELLYTDTVEERARWFSSEQVLANLDARDDALNRLRRIISDRIYSRIIAIQRQPGEAA